MSTQIRRKRHACGFLVCLLLCHHGITHATTGRFIDQGGAIFNVKAYGAAGNDTASDSRAIQNTVDAATAAGGGIVYFPPGRYLIRQTINVARPDLISLIGAGTSSVIDMAADPGVALSRPTSRTGYHSGLIAHLRLSCAGHSPAAAIRTTDIVIAPALFDIDVVRCRVGFDFTNVRYWTERLLAVDITDDNNQHLFQFDQDPHDSNNSFGYGTYVGIYVNKSHDQDVFYLTNGAYLYHSTFVIKGNFDIHANGASIFHLRGSPGAPCPGAAYNTYDIATEGGSYRVVDTDGNGCRGGPAGSALVSGTGFVSATGAVAASEGMIEPVADAAFFAGRTTTTSGTSTVVHAPFISPRTACYVQPANAIAAGMLSGTYVSGSSWGAVTITHPPVSGGEFQVWCQ